MTKRPVLVDTQLLVLLVVGATRPDLTARQKKTSRYTRTDFSLLIDLLGYRPKFVFCPHVASETSNLVAQYGEPDRTSLMTVLRALPNNATEMPVTTASAMEQPEFIRLGLADAAQLSLCTSETLLLTDDEPLFRAATAREVSSLYFTEEKFRRRRFLV